MGIKASITKVSDLVWLSDVNKVGPQLTPQSPISVRQFAVHSGPALSHPECHPYCELGLHWSGSGIEYIEREQGLRRSGDLFVAGPGVPHWFTVARYPLKGTAIYFLPSLLCEFGPNQDGLHILRRFTARQSLSDRLVRPSAALRKQFLSSFAEIAREFETKSLGHEIRLRTLLMDMLVALVRWEQRSGKQPAPADPSPKWEDVSRALRYLKEHFAEPVYARDVACALGMSESRLKILFRETLGIPWSRYMQSYRIQQAVALLSTSECNVTQAALTVGFESLSHFNATFRAFMGMTPSAYLERRLKTAKL